MGCLPSKARDTPRSEISPSPSFETQSINPTQPLDIPNEHILSDNGSEFEPSPIPSEATPPTSDTLQLDPTIELARLQISLHSSIHVDLSTRHVSIGPSVSINETLKRLTIWSSALSNDPNLLIVVYHLKALRSLITGIVKYTHNQSDDKLQQQLPSFFHSCLHNYRITLLLYAEYRSEAPKRRLNPWDLYQMDVPQIVCESGETSADLTKLFTTAINVITWYDNYFWPNLSITTGWTGEKYLHYRMHFPQVDIVNQEITSQIEHLHVEPLIESLDSSLEDVQFCEEVRDVSTASEEWSVQDC